MLQNISLDLFTVTPIATLLTFYLRCCALMHQDLEDQSQSLCITKQTI